MRAARCLLLTALLLVPGLARACPGQTLIASDALGTQRTLCFGGFGGAAGFIAQTQLLDIGGTNGLSINAFGAASVFNAGGGVALTSSMGQPLDLALGQVGSRWLPVGPANQFQSPLPVNGTVTALGGPMGEQAVTPLVQNASYSSGNCLGGFNAVWIGPNKLGGWINSVLVTSVSGQTPTLTVYVFDQKPAASVCTDKSTFTLAGADVDKLVGQPTSVTLAAPTGATPAISEIPFTPPRSFPPSVQTIWLAMVAGSTFTPGSTTDMHEKLNFGLVN